MNAYELAEIMTVHDESRIWEHGLEIANMLRQQADRIAELEKESANLEQSLKNALVFIDNHKQIKPLSDKEIAEVATINLGHSMGLLNWIGFARAIEERHGIK